MLVTRPILAERIAAYLQHQSTLPELVAWAEDQMMEGEFDPSDASVIREVMARLGVADVRAFGLTWEECERMLNRLGFAARVEINAA